MSSLELFPLEVCQVLHKNRCRSVVQVFSSFCQKQKSNSTHSHILSHWWSAIDRQLLKVGINSQLSFRVAYVCAPHPISLSLHLFMHEKLRSDTFKPHLIQHQTKMILSIALIRLSKLAVFRSDMQGINVKVKTSYCEKTVE